MGNAAKQMGNQDTRAPQKNESYETGTTEGAALDSNNYSGTGQAKGQFVGNDNQRAGTLAGRKGVEEVPMEDDTPQRFPEQDGISSGRRQ